MSDQIAMLHKIERFAARKKVQPPPPWKPPVLRDFAWNIQVQAFDQTLSKTGMVHLVADQYGVKVYCKQTFRPKPDPALKSFTRSYEQASLLREELEPVIHCSVEVVYEMPAVHGQRIESSLLAGSVIYDLVRDSEPDLSARVISKQHVGSVLCDDPYASKGKIKEAVLRYIPDSGLRTGWNEHTRDAAAIALTHLYDLKRENDSDQP